MSRSKVKNVKLEMLEIDAFSGQEGSAWFEGYVSALADEGTISEDEIQKLIEWGQNVVDRIDSDKIIRDRRCKLMAQLI